MKTKVKPEVSCKPREEVKKSDSRKKKYILVRTLGNCISGVSDMNKCNEIPFPVVRSLFKIQFQCKKKLLQ